MSDSANMFKKLAQNRQKSTPAKPETEIESEIKSVPESKPPKKTKSKAQAKTPAKKTTPKSTPEEKPTEVAIAKPVKDIAPEEPTKKRGRPATGKRSDPDWIGRTYYIRKETDFDIEDELVKLKRAGINLDKSELVDFLLDAWVKWRNGENISIQISEISPRRKDEKA
ncbi:hypothetical protein I4641_21080 [Waterburya agarophytonicola K14]|uniref:Uncharacterized protein n=1 Tax=Waterburya agarophytonicola KI4 TaxID=2874699 RepID=A0A964FHZ2_9CYAN|nr:hypothetical protein [Waterburya agarophytonicola]MCC0179457.1 hypothetical protein [Waterburya agarophytonicola KI4]